METKTLVIMILGAACFWLLVLSPKIFAYIKKKKAKNEELIKNEMINDEDVEL